MKQISVRYFFHKGSAFAFLLCVFCISTIQLYGQKHEGHDHGPNEPCSHSVFNPISVANVDITDGFWKDRQKVNKEVSMKVLWDIAKDPEKSSAFENFRIAAGMSDLPHRGCDWMDAWIHKWLESASYVLMKEPDYIFEGQKLSELCDEIISVVAAAQQEDGYIATQIITTPRQRWEKRQNHEMYVMGHLLTAASKHYEATGKENYLNVAIKAGNFMHDLFKNADESISQFPENPSIVMGAVDLYRVTEDEKYLELAAMVVDWRGNNWNGEDFKPAWGPLVGNTDQNQNWRPLREETEVVGHSVFWSYLYSGATDVFMENGDTTLLETMERLWKDVTHKKMFVNGGVSAETKGLVTRSFNPGSRVVIEYDPIHEGIAAPYRLPNSTCYNETCGQIGNFMWNWRMLLATGKVQYADVMELNIYNSVISGIELDGEGWSYTNPIRWYGSDHELLRNDSHTRMYPGYRHICCPTNIMRTVASYQQYMYSTNYEGIQLHHYASNQTKLEIEDNGSLSLKQTTNYPWDGKIDLEVVEADLKEATSISFRIPGWANSASIHINGKKQDISATSGEYLKISDKWETGDKVTLEIPFTVDLLVADHKVETAYNQVAVRRGPIIYCLESKDIPEGYNLFDIRIDRNSEWELEDGSGKLKGMTLLSTEASYQPFRAEEETGLYSKLAPSEDEQIPVTLIPYFAWNNRGEPEMSIWLPLK